MSPYTPYHNHLFSRLRALLLLVIFLNAILIEALHHHGVEKSITKSQYTSQSKQLSTAKVKCNLCEVLKHQSHFFNLPAPIVLALPLVKPIVTTDNYILKHPAGFILSCSNKGPPASMA
ncbi:hypothetical protein [Pedobacter kyungheensis]|uniref:hypothetical protein n=1 Tax=Pedobacter kyungheensis TaxID=1069985 RepID=UPI000AFA1D9D|nr:hypothetical protein [Pedobacter kyungheensis]